MSLDTSTHNDASSPEGVPAVDGTGRNAAIAAFPPDRLLPDRQPAYVASWIYVFGVLTVVSLAWVIITGCVLAIWDRPGGTSLGLGSL